ncbi:MAG TPA: rhodanese-like domain-containing protein [Thermoplasmata archaeon]|nr:rhodanese-like domain-containing protein [Thermoplasmata archaeon]
MVDALTPEEVAALLKRDPGGVVLLDVREPFERAEAEIAPSIHIPLREVASRAAEIPKEKHVVVYCHSGTRSMMVAAYLEGHGYSSVSNLEGGIDAWSLRVDPKVPRYG